MIAYGETKRRSGKLHPHNKCAVCSEKSEPSKSNERYKAKKEIQRELVDE